MECGVTRHDGADAPYWQGLAAGRLMLPRCGGKWMWPAGRRDGATGSTDVEWKEVPMRGTVYSWTRTHHRFGLTETLDLPFTTVLVEVDECGIRLLGRLDDPDQVDPVIGEALIGRPDVTLVQGDAIPTIVWSRS